MDSNMKELLPATLKYAHKMSKVSDGVREVLCGGTQDATKFSGPIKDLVNTLLTHFVIHDTDVDYIVDDLFEAIYGETKNMTVEKFMDKWGQALDVQDKQMFISGIINFSVEMDKISFALHTAFMPYDNFEAYWVFEESIDKLVDTLAKQFNYNNLKVKISNDALTSDLIRVMEPYTCKGTKKMKIGDFMAKWGDKLK